MQASQGKRCPAYGVTAATRIYPNQVLWNFYKDDRDVAWRLIEERTFWKSAAFIWAHPYSFIHSGYFYSVPSSPLLLRGAPDYSTDTVSEFHAELYLKDLPKVYTWWLERE